MTIIAVDDNRNDLDLISDIIYDINPDFEILEFDSPFEALAEAREKEIDVAIIAADMPGLSGTDLGTYLKEINPFTNIIFLSSDKEASYKAIKLHASGYILKPATIQLLKQELEDLRYPEIKKRHKRVFAQTFGNFELFVDGEPVNFKYQKTKEIVAVLVNNRGAQTTNGEIIACLWEDDGDPEKKVSYLSNLRQDLQNTLARLKLEGIIVKQRGSMAIAKDKIECDLFDYMENKSYSRYSYTGDYMNQYSWAEPMHAQLYDMEYI